MSKPRVLMLPKWYPNRYDDQDGDFVARHIQAIAPHATVGVLFARVASEALPTLLLCEADLHSPVPALRYYYRAQPTGFNLLDQLLKPALYFWCLGCGYRRMVQHWGAAPTLVHVHVLLRTGLFAWWLKLTRRIPYIVTEHWTLYLPERAADISWLRRRLTQWVVRRAAALHTVSGALGAAMHRLGFVNERAVVIANAVDTQLFVPGPEPRVPGQLLHVSAFHDEVKNISGVLRVMARLRPQWPQMRLRIAGYGPDEALLRQLAADLNLLADGTVVFLGKLPHPAVAREMQQAAALVSFSRAETFGCVLLEARATGCPVVGPATGGVPELFDAANTFGLLLPPDDETALAQALTTVLTGAVSFPPQTLQADAQARCSYAEVGWQFARLYAQVLGEPRSPFPQTLAS